jgi:hypothetical protein
MLLRAYFRFPRFSELRFLDQLPMKGSVMRLHGARWFISGQPPGVGGAATLIDAMSRRAHSPSPLHT